MANPFTLNKYEIEVLKMTNGDIPWEAGAWVNACAEFLSENGYCAYCDYTLTQKGKDYLEQLKIDNNK